MPVVNIGLQRTRDLVRGSGTMNAAVDSIGFGTDSAAEAAADVKLGADTGKHSYWKTSTDVTWTTGGDGTADPYWQAEATWSTTEISAGGEVTLFELGTSAGSLSGTDPAGQDGTKLYSRKRIGGTGGIGKTNDIELTGRVKVTY